MLTTTLRSTGRTALVVALGFGGLIALGACGSSGASTNPPRPAAAAPSSITIKSFTFSPDPLAAKAGTTVTVTNDDGTDHTITADDGSFDTGRFSTGQRTLKVGAPGTYRYHCDVHDFMRGVIEVAPA